MQKTGGLRINGIDHYRTHRHVSNKPFRSFFKTFSPSSSLGKGSTSSCCRLPLVDLFSRLSGLGAGSLSSTSLPFRDSSMLLLFGSILYGEIALQNQFTSWHYKYVFYACNCQGYTHRFLSDGRNLVLVYLAFSSVFKGILYGVPQNFSFDKLSERKEWFPVLYKIM